MVAFRIGTITLTTLDDEVFATVLEAAAREGGIDSFPALFGLLGSEAETDPVALMDDLAHLSATETGQRVAVLVGKLRDDLMEAVAASDEG
jgi:hypothetical protein